MTLGFRSRVFLYLAGLVALAIAAASFALEQVAARRMEERFADRFTRARTAFHELESLRLRFIAEKVGTLVQESPQLRTVLSTASLSADFDLGLGAPAGGADTALRDANLRLRSLLPSLALAEPGEALVVLSSILGASLVVGGIGLEGMPQVVVFAVLLVVGVSVQMGSGGGKRSRRKGSGAPGD